jgi:hypothetical protein
MANKQFVRDSGCADNSEIGKKGDSCALITLLVKGLLFRLNLFGIFDRNWILLFTNQDCMGQSSLNGSMYGL